MDSTYNHGSEEAVDEEPYFFDLGSSTRPVTTKSPTAQIWFDRGLQWSYAFNQYDATALTPAQHQGAHV